MDLLWRIAGVALVAVAAYVLINLPGIGAPRVAEPPEAEPPDPGEVYDPVHVRADEIGRDVLGGIPVLASW